MTMIRDVQERLAQLLEPEGSGVTRVVLDKEPTEWEPEHLYVIAQPVEEVPFETGSSRRQNFTLNAVYITEDDLEGATLDPSEDLATAMDNKRGQYMRAVRENQTTDLWLILRAVSDTPNPLPIDKRSAAVRISGWRVIAGGA